MAEISIIPYTESYEEKWDKFVLYQSVNGTILQTRKFLNYHPQDRFVDSSLMVMKGSKIIGVIPANLGITRNRKVMYSHEGSTFGGIIIEKSNIKVSVLEKIYTMIDQYCLENCINVIHFKMPSSLYSRKDSEMLDYMFFNHRYTCSLEVGYYINFQDYKDDIISNYSSSVRRHYKAAKNNGLFFRELMGREGISLFYGVLLDNYKKFGTTPVHSLIDLYSLKEVNLKDNVRFFGVFNETTIVASSMVFCFERKVFHTQYLASLSSYSHLYVNEFLYTSLIKQAKEENYPYLSFGTVTLEGGIKLNYNLAQYKEQYGTDQYVNRTYHKNYEESLENE